MFIMDALASSVNILPLSSLSGIGVDATFNALPVPILYIVSSSSASPSNVISIVNVLPVNTWSPRSGVVRRASISYSRASPATTGTLYSGTCGGHAPGLGLSPAIAFARTHNVCLASAFTSRLWLPVISRQPVVGSLSTVARVSTYSSNSPLRSLANSV